MKHPTKTVLQPGAIRPHHKSKNSQAHPGVSPLNPVSHRNTSFQPLPRPLINTTLPKIFPLSPRT